MIKSTGFIPQNQNSNAGSMNADINIYTVNAAKGKKPTCILQVGKWVPEVVAEENIQAKPGYFQPAGFNIPVNIGVQKDDPNFMELIEFTPDSLPKWKSGSNPTEQLISQLEVKCLALLKATYPDVTFEIS